MNNFLKQKHFRKFANNLRKQEQFLETQKAENGNIFWICRINLRTYTIFGKMNTFCKLEHLFFSENWNIFHIPEEILDMQTLFLKWEHFFKHLKVFGKTNILKILRTFFELSKKIKTRTFFQIHEEFFKLLNKNCKT